MVPLVQIGDFEHALLQLFDKLLLLVCAFLGQISSRTDLACLLLVLGVQLCVVLSQLSESLARGCLNLETFDLLEDVRSIHTLYDRICVTYELFSEHFCIL